MRSIKFPDMFNKNSTNVWKASEHKAATMQNSLLLLQSERGELFGDPYYGVLLQHLLYDQNNDVLKDAVIDVIYTQLALFIPQVKVNRNDIEIIQNKETGKLYCNFTGTDQVDYTINTYQLVLYDTSDVV